MALLALVPLLIFAAFAAKRLSDGTRENAIRAMKETANVTASIVDRELQGALSAVLVLSRSPLLLDEKFEQFYDQALSSASGANGWVILYSPDGRQWLNTRLPYGAPLLVRPSPEELQHIISASEIHISGMVWSPALKKHVIFIDVPVKTRSGKSYVLSQAVYSDHFGLAFKERDIPASWVVGIFDKNGITIGRSVNGDEFVGKRANPDTLAAIRSPSDSMLKHTIRGNIHVYDVITHSDLSGWGVAVGVPVDEIDRQVREAGYIATGGLLLAVIAALIGAGVVGRRLASSIENAATAAEMLGKSEALPTMRPSGTHEIDNLQEAIVSAARKLKDAEARNIELLESERTARQVAEIENKRKDEFLAMLGHELRNPLSAITSAISLLRLRVGDDPAVRRPADVIHRQSEHLRSLLNDLLELSRVIYGKVQLELQPTDLGALVTASIQNMMDTARLSRHTFSFSTESVFVNIDRTRMEQIFSNLIDNAVKYTDEGGSIRVSVTIQDDLAVLRVADKGVGIGPDLLPYVFDIFVQGDNTLARTKGGMGIGLSLIHKLVSLHGGTVSVQSEGAGKGSVFEVRLPLLVSDAFAPARNVLEPESPLQGCKVLLVEDQDDLREMGHILLTELGLDMRSAANGREALALAAAHQPAVAIIDIGLPDMSGYELAAALRSAPQTASMRLIALSGYGLAEDKARAAAAGFDLHLTKPLSLDDLTQYLASLSA
ncbi:hybrid sensor histidine kinase/response regulator [Herbaspirillum sp. alder98]|uniref:hybrid sensor histidine kinase/response regulator n=1 Tax=Herbaspirillum sp. alder98 TaxID=2913096 RepID=UPI001CD8C84C|nr:hybrid sensor histidine kinase/response regulator [Herbaspirillum sp. alder98]MCA1323739.1 response regulator [Herbaspirillum sp. alder98]